jgi:hypothetical protein
MLRLAVSRAMQLPTRVPSGAVELDGKKQRTEIRRRAQQRYRNASSTKLALHLQYPVVNILISVTDCLT